MQVKSIEGVEAELEFGGVKYKANIMLTPEVKIGDYVLLHTGYAISIIEQEEAEKTLRIFQEMEDLSKKALSENGN
jgi:hydrogenase expression/formation protein HypC